MDNKNKVCCTIKNKIKDAGNKVIKQVFPFATIMPFVRYSIGMTRDYLKTRIAEKLGTFIAIIKFMGTCELLNS